MLREAGRDPRIQGGCEGNLVRYGQGPDNLEHTVMPRSPTAKSAPCVRPSCSGSACASPEAEDGGLHDGSRRHEAGRARDGRRQRHHRLPRRHHDRRGPVRTNLLRSAGVEQWLMEDTPHNDAGIMRNTARSEQLRLLVACHCPCDGIVLQVLPERCRNRSGHKRRSAADAIKEVVTVAPVQDQARTAQAMMRNKRSALT